MTTRLAGPATRFLPFNQGDHGAAGNPAEPGRHRTAYLWEAGVGSGTAGWRSWAATWSTQRDDKKQIKAIIFPRYHQLDATRKLRAAVLDDGPGGKYLIQHSAGSGKTNSIAWSAHFLADLHDAEHKKLFDTVLVVSDRNVIDCAVAGGDLRFRAHHRRGGDHQRRRRQQERAAGGGAVGRQEDHRLHDPDLSLCAEGGAGTGGDRGQALRGDRRRGAQLADRRGGREAEGGAYRRRKWRSCRTAARSSTEDILAAQMAARAGQHGHHLSWRSPRRPRRRRWSCSARGPIPAGRPARTTCRSRSTSTRCGRRSRRGFILDVLQNYTTYKLAFKLAHEGKEYDETAGRAQRGDEGDHGLGAAAPLQHRPEGADRRGALPRERRAAAGRAGPRRWWWWPAGRRRCAGSWRSTSTSRTAATRSARWWRSPAR